MDYAFSGPALLSFPQLIRHLLNGDNKSCESIDGVFTKKNSVSAEALPDATGMGQSSCSQLKGIGLLGRELDINVPVDEKLRIVLRLIS